MYIKILRKNPKNLIFVRNIYIRDRYFQRIMVCNIKKIILDSESRIEHMKYMMNLEGLSDSEIKRIIQEYKGHLDKSKTLGLSSVENVTNTSNILDNIIKHYDETGNFEALNCCYSGLALTNVTKDEMGPLMNEHQLIRKAVAATGMMNYDPAEAPFNPQQFAIGNPKDIYKLDTLMVLASKVFTFSSLSASSGGGIEVRTAITYNKMPFVFCNNSIKVSRMLTGIDRALIIGYDNMQEQHNQVIDMIGEFKDFDLGVGHCEDHGNSLIGFKDNKTYCLHGHLEKVFPQLVYQYKK